MREELFADSEAYEIQKAIIQRAINTDHSRGGDVRILDIDYKAFEKDREEKAFLKTMRNMWRKEMKAKHGSSWTKRAASRSFSAMN